MKWFLMILPFLVGVLGVATMAYALFNPAFSDQRSVGYFILGGFVTVGGFVGCFLVKDAFPVE